MSGHSHFATIKRQKAANDAVKGNLFSKLARAIMIAAKSGGDPDTNFKLRVEIDKAKASGLPKDNIERAIGRATSEGNNMEEITYEGFGPRGVALMIETATDNKNRTSQEIKNILDKAGGSLGGPGAVSYNFESKGFMLIKKSDKPDEQMLKLIDYGVGDMNEVEDGIEVYVSPHELSNVRKKLLDGGFEILETQMQMKPINTVKLEDQKEFDKVIKLLEVLDEQDDVSNVYSNLE